MIKCEVVDNNPVYHGEEPHIVFFFDTAGVQRYIIASPIFVSGVVTDPDEVKVIKQRGYKVDAVFAVEDVDINTLRGMYATKHKI